MTRRAQSQPADFLSMDPSQWVPMPEAQRITGLGETKLKALRAERGLHVRLPSRRRLLFYRPDLVEVAREQVQPTQEESTRALDGRRTKGERR